MTLHGELSPQGADSAAKTYARAALIASVGLSLAALISAVSLFF